MKKRQGFKPGRLSEKEKSYIRSHSATETDFEMSQRLNRPEEAIIQYRLQWLEKNPELKIQDSTFGQILTNLKEEPEWEFLKQQFSSEELKLFETQYATLMAQFEGNVLATEKQQIYHAVMLQIFIYRSNIDRRLSDMRTAAFTKLIDEEMNKKDDGENKERTDRIIELTKMQDDARASSASKTKELKDLMDKYQSTLKDLKGTREQRIQKIESSKQSFVGVLRRLENEDSRRQIGIEINLMEAATEKERERLSQLHTYQDGEIDRPIIDSKTVLRDDNE